MKITDILNNLTFNEAEEVRALFSQLIGKEVDESFLLIPPFYTTGGQEISVGENSLFSFCTYLQLWVRYSDVGAESSLNTSPSP